MVDLVGRYSNRPDLLEQLRKVVVILAEAAGQVAGDGRPAGGKTCSGVRSRRLRDRFTAEELQTMVDLYASGVAPRVVAERFGVSRRSVTRLLRERGVGPSRRLQDRFTTEQLQAMIDLYASGVASRVVAERFGVNQRSLKRLLQERGVRRRAVSS